MSNLATFKGATKVEISPAGVSSTDNLQVASLGAGQAPAGTGVVSASVRLDAPMLVTSGSQFIAQDSSPNVSIYSLRLRDVVVSSLPSGSIGYIASVSDGQSGLTFGNTVTGGGSTPYLVWYNGTHWTVIGK